LKAERLHSEFRTGYFIQIFLTLAGFAGGALYILASDLFGGYRLAVALALLAAGLWIAYKLFVPSLVRVWVDEHGVGRRHLLGGKTEYFPFDRVEKITMDAFQIENLNGPLTEPVPEIYVWIDGRPRMYLASNVYANFMPLAVAIIRGVRRSRDRQLEETARKIISLYKKRLQNGRTKQKAD